MLQMTTIAQVSTCNNFSLGFILRDGGNFTTNTDIILTGDFEIESDGFDNTNNATISADNLRFVLGDYLNNRRWLHY